MGTMLQKLIFCCLFVGSLSPLKSQTIFTSFQPDDRGIGIGYRTDKMYVSYSYGEYKLNKGYMEHSKIALGGVLCPQNSIYSGQSFITIGLCLHSYNKQSPQEFQRIVTYPLSIELGCGTYLGKVSIGFNFDLIKNESSLYLGIKIR
jgi:hypothetical protein